MQQPARQPLLQKVWQQFKNISRSFFFGPAGQDSGDHLVEVVRRNPVVAAQFLKSSCLSGIVGTFAVSLACAFFLSQYWSRCGSCGRPLRWWLIGHVCMQMSQVPVRAVLYASVRKVSAAWTVEDLVLSFTASPAWRVSKMVSLMLYGWFVLGVIWWMNLSNECESCPGISILFGAVLLLSAARFAITLIGQRELFSFNAAEPQIETPKTQPASQCQIRWLPLTRVAKAKPVSHCRADSSSALRGRRGSLRSSYACCTAGDHCAVCLDDFEEGDWVRRLPCLHHFHPPCIDRWLLQNKRCPLCMHPIDEVFIPPCGKEK